MSRKFLDDNISIKQLRPFLPSTTLGQASAFDPGHMFADAGDGTIFVNEGSRPGGSIFGHKWVNREDLLEQFLQAPDVLANVDPASFASQAAIRSYTAANKQFVFNGNNAATTNSVLTAGGGVKLTTTTASGDQGIISPLVLGGGAAASQWAQGVLTQSRPIWEAVIKTDTVNTLQTVFGGLKLTNTSNSATDANQAFFKFTDIATLPGGLGQFVATTSASTTLTQQNTGVVVTASTTYHLKITVDTLRVPRYFINGILVATGPALTSAITLLPFLGIQTGTTAARNLEVRAIRMSKDLL